MAEFFSPGPGERLRAARLSMGYDLAKIATELHLTTPVVETLEADEYTEIGARVFVRGYLRNYARIVGMPVESILRQFDEKWPDDTAAHSMVRESPTLPADGGPSRGWAGAITWLLIVGLLVLFLMWWRGYLDEIVPEQIRSGNLVDGRQDRGNDDATPSDLGMMDGLPELPRGGLRLPSGESMSGDFEQGGAGSLDVPADSVGIGEIALPPMSSGAAISPKDGAATTPVETPLNSQTPPLSEAGSPAAASEAAQDSTGGAPVVDATRQIVMAFSAPCWVDVRDSERNFKLFGEMPQGSRRVLGGKPPYKMIIGNANAVTLTVNGRPFDLAPYAKGNVARFTLSP